MSDDNSGENELAKRYYVLPADHPLRKHNLGLGGYREKRKQGIPNELLKEIDDRISLLLPLQFGPKDPPHARAIPKQISQDGKLVEPPDETLRRAELFRDYERLSGHPVPGWAIRNCENLSKRLERAIREDKPIVEFLCHSRGGVVGDCQIHHLRFATDKKD